MTRPMRVAYLLLAPILAVAMTAQPASAEPGGWLIETGRSALTDQPSVTATLASRQPLLNMIGRPEAATLVLRCSERVLAAYVAWPEVLSHDTNNFIGEPKTLALVRLDEGEIAASYWTISDDGSAAGAFTSNASTKLITAWQHSRRMVVRMTGRTSQDAVFDLDGIAEVAAQVLIACKR